jgi:hypothetical protein
MSHAQTQPRSLNRASGGGLGGEFRVQFSSSGGASLLRSPENSFGWAGIGTVGVERNGLLVTARRRSFLRLRRDRRYIPAFEIQEIYREAAAVRVDLREDGPRRRFFWFWAENASAAESVVKLLDVKRSVELDSPGGALSAADQRGGPWTLLAAGIATLVVLSTLFWRLGLRHDGHSPTTIKVQPKLAQATQDHSVLSRSDSVSPQSDLVPPQPDALDASVDLLHFEEEMNGLRVEFSSSFEALQQGTLSQDDFANRLTRSLIPRWETLRQELASEQRSDGSAAAAVRAALTKSTVEWQHALKLYAAGLRVGDADVVLIAFEHLQRAEADQFDAESAVRLKTNTTTSR